MGPMVCGDLAAQKLSPTSDTPKAGGGSGYARAGVRESRTACPCHKMGQRAKPLLRAVHSVVLPQEPAWPRSDALQGSPWLPGPPLRVAVHAPPP